MGDSFPPITVVPATYPQTSGDKLYVARAGVAEMEADMSDDCVSLLKECSSGCKMAYDSIRQVREYAKEEELKKILDSYADKHEELEQKTISLLGKYGKKDKEPGAMAKMYSWLDTEMKMLMNADNHQIAKLMMDGCNMGIQKISEHINQYAGADEECEAVAKELVKIEEDFMEEMKAFI
ncbi:MAG: hypothetical protein LUH14_00215 [Clostridiaceae bacterium]|nr:hypothetical protein [Clostridiaceae bacterium]